RTFGTELGYLRELNRGGKSLRPWSELVLSPRFDLDFRRIVEAFPPLIADGAAPVPEMARLLKRRMVDFVRGVCLGTVYHGGAPGPLPALLDELRSLGADAADLDSIGQEVRVVCETMQDRAFSAFVAEVAPQYLEAAR